MIEVKNIYKSFNGKPVLKNVSLCIEEGETTAIIGRSGSGKSVLLKHLVGLLKPDEGEVLIDGVDINQLSYDRLRKVRQDFGVLFQGGALFDSMNAFENVAFPLRTFTRMGEAEVRERAQECLDLVELKEAGGKRPAELSGGMQKRVALARAIALRPKYVLYDEPTSGLDPHTSHAINDLISSLADQLGITSVVISHDMHSVLQVADRAAYVHDARLHWVGTIEEMHRSDDELLLDFVKANEYSIGSTEEKVRDERSVF